MKRIATSVLLIILLISSINVSALPMELLEGYTDPAYLRPMIDANVSYKDKNQYVQELVAEGTGIGKNSPLNLDFKLRYYLYDVTGVYLQFVDNETKQTASNETYRVKGTLTFYIKYPTDAGIDMPKQEVGSMHGFVKNDENGNLAIYEDVERKITKNNDGTSTLTITVKIKNPDNSSLDYITGNQLINHPEYFGDIEYVQTASITKGGTYPITMTVREELECLELNDGKETHIITIKMVPEPKSAIATATVTGTELTINVKNGNNIIIPADKSGKVNLKEVTIPERKGFVVSEFFKDSSYTQVAEDIVDVKDVFEVYVKYVNVTPPEIMNSQDHNAYVMGYPDGTICPEDNITRDEVSTILYRLLKEDVRKEFESSSNGFIDVTKDMWSNTYVSTMAKGGFLKGYSDGTFRPEDSITRAEFVTILSRLYGDNLPEIQNSKCNYTDIKGHWAEDYIKAIYELEIVNGYQDGKFKPDKNITRAEVMAIVNRTLVRYAGSSASGAKKWTDVNAKDWYYKDILEATNSHTFERLSNGYTEKHLQYFKN